MMFHMAMFLLVCNSDNNKKYVTHLLFLLPKVFVALLVFQTSFFSADQAVVECSINRYYCHKSSLYGGDCTSMCLAACSSRRLWRVSENWACVRKCSSVSSLCFSCDSNSLFSISEMSCVVEPYNECKNNYL